MQNNIIVHIEHSDILIYTNTQKLVRVTRMSQMFSNILVTWGTIQHLWMLLLRLWRWWTTLGWEMSYSPDTLYICYFRIHGFRFTRPCLIIKVLSLSETSRQIHLPRKQRLINREGHRHTTDEGMDSYR